MNSHSIVDVNNVDHADPRYVKLHTLTKSDSAHETLSAEICVVGAGIAGMSAALTAAELGRKVVLVDAMPVLGGQCANSLIGLFCGIYGNGPEYRQLTYGIFPKLFKDLEATGDISYNYRHTITVNYDEIAVGRWFENEVMRTGVTPLTSASILRVNNEGGHIHSVDFSTQFGEIRVEAEAFIDATGDAALTWEAGLPCRVPDRTIWGSQQVRLENLVPEAAPAPEELVSTMQEKAEEYGLIRKNGLAFFFPGRDTAVMNMTHIESPLNPAEASLAQIRGRDQADRVARFLKDHFPAAFGNAKARLYGYPGRRQTRWIKSHHQLTLEEVRNGTEFDDVIARTSWPIELHGHPDGYTWDVFDSDHVHQVPLRSIIPWGSENLIVAGRCVDGEAAALSSVRVMGPCAAMGEAAAHVQDLTLGQGIAALHLPDLKIRISKNIQDKEIQHVSHS